MALNFLNLQWLINSPYFVMDLDNWHLKEDAPPELKKKFEEFKKERLDSRD